MAQYGVTTDVIMLSVLAVLVGLQPEEVWRPLSAVIADWDWFCVFEALFIGKHALLLILVGYSSLLLKAVALCSLPCCSCGSSRALSLLLRSV